MAKVNVKFALPVTFLKEGRRFVAYSPAIDLSTSGETYQEAQKRFGEAAFIFFEEIIKKKTIETVLRELGWQRIKKTWQPPTYLSRKFPFLLLKII